MDSIATTIAGLENELAALDGRLQEEEAKKQQLLEAIAAVKSKQQADEAEIAVLIKEIAEMECRLEDAASLGPGQDDACDKPCNQDLQLQVSSIKLSLILFRSEAWCA